MLLLATLFTVMGIQSGYAHPEMLVDTAWVAAHLTDPDLRVIDMRRNGASDFAAGHVPGAVNLVNEAIRDPSNRPTFVPSQATFEAVMRRLGVSNTTRVVVYDERGGLYAARLWWILSYFGHTNVALMDGGWGKWVSEKRPVSTDPPAVAQGRFSARPQPRWVATADDVKAATENTNVRIVDARTAAEIEGTDLRGIRRGGHVPGAVAVYWEDTLDKEQRTFKPAQELRKLFEQAGVTPSNEIIAYCQVGMRASHDLFVLRLLGYERLRNYYGAWEEWGNRDDLPIAAGPIAPGKPR
jgi:thiosulfate/3-mercaptopyruvate sulfurtransferase